MIVVDIIYPFTKGQLKLTWIVWFKVAVPAPPTCGTAHALPFSASCLIREPLALGTPQGAGSALNVIHS